jgi:S-adenosylmethionine synthetase
VQIHVHPLLDSIPPIEVVERKGKGHPDSIADALAESFSAALSRYYLDHFGRILHHNVDKALLFAGQSRPAFGGGTLLQPIEVYLCGRVTARVGSDVVPVQRIAEDAVRDWFSRSLRFVDPDRHVRVHCLVRSGAAELSELADNVVPCSGDTSFGVGFAPFSALERMVLGVEQDLTSPATLAAMPFIGEDVKVMGVRTGAATELTVAAPLVDRFVRDPADYALKKTRITNHVAALTGAPVTVNAADSEGRLYLTVLGTSAEAGDDGQVGRGNRVTGLLTPGRPMTLEATAGKNPYNHAGKIYAVAAQHIAADLVATVPGLIAARCTLVSRIGQPIADPWLVSLQLATDGRPLTDLRSGAEAVVRAQLVGLGALTLKMTYEKIAMF